METWKGMHTFSCGNRNIKTMKQKNCPMCEVNEGVVQNFILPEILKDIVKQSLKKQYVHMSR